MKTVNEILISLQTRIHTNVALLKTQDKQELADLLEKLMGIVDAEQSESLDREALLKQVQIISEQATVPKDERNDLLVNAALSYISLFSSVKSIGSFLIEHRERLDRLLK
jgi:hypothetical protein